MDLRPVGCLRWGFWYWRLDAFRPYWFRIGLCPRFAGTGKKLCLWDILGRLVGFHLMFLLHRRYGNETDLIGIGAISSVEYARQLFPDPGESDEEINKLTNAMVPGMFISMHQVQVPS